MVSPQVLVLVPFGWLFLYIMGTFNSHVNHVQWVHRVNETIQRNPSFVHISPAGKARKGKADDTSNQTLSKQWAEMESWKEVFFSWCAVCVLSRFRHVRLCDPMDCSPPGSSVCGILQARILEWVSMPSSRGSSWPPGNLPDLQGSNPCLLFPALAGVFLTTSTTWEPHGSGEIKWAYWLYYFISHLTQVYK